jgi:hypothetical protein
MLRNSSFRDRQSRQFDQACAKPVKFEYLMEYKGIKIILTDHVRDRARQRHGMPVEQMKVYFQHVIDGLVDFPWVEYNQEIFVYSRAFNRGMIIARRRDFKNQGNRDMAYVAVTMYPFGRGYPAQKDTEVVYV